MVVSAKHDACGSGPVITEWDIHKNKVRAVCCSCWEHTALKDTPHEAAEAWKAGKTMPWKAALTK